MKLTASFVACLALLVTQTCGKCTKSFRDPQKKPCPSGTNDDGTHCWKTWYGRIGRVPDLTPCPPGTEADTSNNCVQVEHTYDKGCCCQRSWSSKCCNNCKDGYIDADVKECKCTNANAGTVTLTLFERVKCKKNEERYDRQCYPKCAEGYQTCGCSICFPHAEKGIEVSADQRMYCEDGSPVFDGKCVIFTCK